MKNSIKKITFLLIAIMVVVTMFATSVKAEELEEMEIEVIDEMDIIGGSATLLFDDGNGGTYEPLCITVGIPPQEYELPVPEREGYAFFGWYYGDIEITGENVYDAFPIFRAGEVSTVYASWGSCDIPSPSVEPKLEIDGGSMILSFDDGFEGEYESISIGVGTAPKEYVLPVPTKEGYAFLGWYYGETEITGKNVYDAFPVLKSGETSTVYARWGGCGYQPMPEPVAIVEIIEEKDDGYISGQDAIVPENIMPEVEQTDIIDPVIGEALIEFNYDYEREKNGGNEEVTESNNVIDEVDTEYTTTEENDIQEENDDETKDVVIIEDEVYDLPTSFDFIDVADDTNKNDNSEVDTDVLGVKMSAPTKSNYILVYIIIGVCIIAVSVSAVIGKNRKNRQ